MSEQAKTEAAVCRWCKLPIKLDEGEWVVENSPLENVCPANPTYWAPHEPAPELNSEQESAMPLSQQDTLIAAGNDLETLIVKAQKILEKRLKPDGISAEEAIDELLGLLDGPQQRAAQMGWKKATSG